MIDKIKMLHQYCYFYDTDVQRVYFVERAHEQRRFNTETEGKTNIFYFSDYSLKRPIEGFPTTRKMVMFCVRQLSTIENLRLEEFELHPFQDEWKQEHLRFRNRIYLMPVKDALHLIDVIAETEDQDTPEDFNQRLEEIINEWNQLQYHNFLNGVKNKAKYPFQNHYQYQRT
jgi:hypothetical protein